MTQIEPSLQSLFDCPICLSPLLSPITLPCGHKYSTELSSFCQPCIKNKGFKVLQPLCPICRRQIRVKIKVLSSIREYFDVNLILDRLVREKYGHSEFYMERMSCYERLLQSKKNIGLLMGIYKRLKRIIKLLYRSSVVRILLAALFFALLLMMMRVRINVFNMQVPEQYKAKAIEMVKKVKSEASLDFKFLLFSQFVRILFSNIIIR